MRLYVSILAVAALSTAACSKKAPEAKPEPAKTEEPKKEEPTAKEEPKKEEPTAAKEEPAKEEPAKEEPKPATAADRTEGVQKALENWAAGKYDEVYANFTDDAVRYEVGDPNMPEIKGKQAIIDASKKMAESMSDAKVKASRIIEAGDTQIVEAVMTANIKTKGADGAEVVKPVAVNSAMVLTYNAEGKVTAMWHFMDGMSVMQQAGIAPGLPEGFVAPTLPETTEIVKGDANPNLMATYKAFGEKMKPDTIDQAIADLIADDYKMVDFHSGKTVGKADMAAFMKGWMGMFADQTMTVDKEITAGEYLVTVTTNTATYKTGIEGAKADTKVTTHELAISRIVDGKFKSWAGYMNGLEFASQLGLLGGAAEKPADAAADTGATLGVAECDLYVTKMTECLGKMPEAVKANFENGMKQAVEGWKTSITAGGDTAKTAIQATCKQMVDTTKTAVANLCPDVKWE